MSNAILGERMFVTLQFADGRVISGETMCATFSVDNMTYGGNLNLWSLELQGIGDLMDSAQFEKQLAVQRSASEWKCPFCGSVNPRQHRQCEACNARRPFVWDD